MNLVPHKHDTHTTDQRRRSEVDLWHWFLERVSWILGSGQMHQKPAPQLTTEIWLQFLAQVFNFTMADSDVNDEFVISSYITTLVVT